MILFDESEDPNRDHHRSSGLVRWSRRRRKFRVEQHGNVPSAISIDMPRPGLFLLGVRSVWWSLCPWGE